MELDPDPLPIPNPKCTTKGVSLVGSENPTLFEQLGEDIIMFAEWSQNYCSWRRRGYMVVVHELTRLIHREFSEAQIEVRFLSQFLILSYMDRLVLV